MVPNNPRVLWARTGAAKSTLKFEKGQFNELYWLPRCREGNPSLTEEYRGHHSLNGFAGVANSAVNGNTTRWCLECGRCNRSQL